MPFPETQRVVYGKNPLDEVACLLVFPPILKIEAEPPAAFQELVRESYPLYEKISEAPLPDGIPEEAARLLAADLPMFARKQHSFDSRDRVWEVRLGQQSLALTCRSYQRWESFRERLRLILEAFVGVYRPAFFTALRLRYVDVLRRSLLGLEDVPWAELIRAELCGGLGASTIAEEIRNFEQQTLIVLPDGAGQTQLRCYLGHDTETEETVFVIDGDFVHDQPTERSDVLSRLDTLKRHAGHCFRWSITGRLHEAMVPSPIPGPA